VPNPWPDSERLDLLFEHLAEADPDGDPPMRANHLTEWGKSGSAAMDLLFRRGEDAMDAGTPMLQSNVTALVDHAPDFAEGYNGRASAYYQMGLYGPD
jgi:hypothetical protein